jgi:hypothetical protein
MDSLNRHFRQFGEVRKLTVKSAEGKAYVQFASRVAADMAFNVPVLGNHGISLAWEMRPQRSSKGGKGRGRHAKRNEPERLEKPIDHRVLCVNPDDQRKLDDARRRRDEIHDRKAKLLAGFTEQMKAIMERLNDKSVSEAKRDILRNLALQIKAKIDSLSDAPPGDFTQPVHDLMEQEFAQESAEGAGPAEESSALEATPDSMYGKQAFGEIAAADGSHELGKAEAEGPIDVPPYAAATEPMEPEDTEVLARLEAPVEEGNAEYEVDLSDDDVNASS